MFTQFPMQPVFFSAGTRRNAPERAGTRRNAPERAGTRRNAPERAGTRRNAPERAGTRRNAPERAGTRRNAPERAGTRRNAPERAGTRRNAPERAGTRRNAPERARTAFRVWLLFSRQKAPYIFFSAGTRRSGVRFHFSKKKALNPFKNRGTKGIVLINFWNAIGWPSQLSFADSPR